jgi:hypothetical protein
MRRAVRATSSALVCWALSASAFAQIPLSNADKALVDATEPQRNFFMQQLGSCPQCQTLTIVVSEEKLQANLLEAFRSIADRLGKNNAGAVTSSYELWKNWKIFADHGCSGMEQFGERYVLFLDRTGSFCVVFPFRNGKHLLGVLEIIERNLKDRGNIDAEKWRYATTASIDEYFRSSQGIELLRAGALAFLDHLATLLRRKQ